jgi:diguanylate cyclase (GGDEF)-like protein
VLGSGANDGQLVSLDDALMLVNEVQRLRAELAKCEARILELDRLAHWDVLVDLPNRRRFVVSLERAIAKVDRYGGDAAVLFLDVDGLKRVNDKFGHNAGDKVLAQVARLLRASVRQADLVARLAGDEFAVLLENTDEFQAWEMALRIVEAVDDCEFSLDGMPLPLSVAAGVAPIRSGDIAETVLSRADEAMYRIKASCPVG